VVRGSNPRHFYGLAAQPTRPTLPAEPTRPRCWPGAVADSTHVIDQVRTPRSPRGASEAAGDDNDNDAPTHLGAPGARHPLRWRRHPFRERTSRNHSRGIPARLLGYAQP
jgi:hypothetical protein